MLGIIIAVTKTTGHNALSQILSAFSPYITGLLAIVVLLRVLTAFKPKSKRSRRHKQRRQLSQQEVEILRQKREQRAKAKVLNARIKGVSAIFYGIVVIGCVCLLFNVSQAIRPLVERVAYIAVPVSLILILVGIIRIVFAGKKGRVGEIIISARLRSGLPKEEYEVIDDVYLPMGGGTTQVDHIVVSRYGVFVIETKNYTGWIFANGDSPNWTQIIYRGKSTFQNPSRQNYRHICAISENLGLPKEYIHGVVVFTGDCKFKTQMPVGVVYSRDAVDYIRSFSSPILKGKEVAEISEAIKLWNASVTHEQRASHVDNLRKTHSAPNTHDPQTKASNPVCPRCGRPMVIRTNRKTGEQFWGCSAYPSCRGIIQQDRCAL